jgi:hypothetical protein
MRGKHLPGLLQIAARQCTALQQKCRKKQKIAKLTPVHRFDAKNFKPPSGPKNWMGTLSAG